MKKRAAIALASIGLVSMLGQVVLLRELAVASFGVELVFLAGTACWMAAGAAGALVPPRLDLRAALPLGLGLVALLLPAEVAFLRAARTLLGEVPGAYLPLGRQLLTVAIGLAPAGALLGWLFRCGARAAAAAGGSVAAAYAWESLGGAVGCAAATAAPAAGFSNLALALAGGALAAAAGAAFLERRRPVLLVLASALVALLASAPALDRRSTGWSHPGLAHAEDTPYGRLALVEAEGQLTVFRNDALVWNSEGTEAEGLVHPAALEASPAPRVLVLEGGLFGIAAEVLQHRPSRMDVVELDGAIPRALLPRLPAEARAALADPAVRLVTADPRGFLGASPDRYDLILVGAGEPSSGLTNRLYTTEFFARCASRLAPGGVVALRLPSLENLWTPALARRNGAVHAALRSVFGDVLLLPGQTDVLIASSAPLVRDPAELAARMRARGIAGREITPESLRWLLTNDRGATAERLLAAAGAAPNTDLRPACYQQTALLWLGRLRAGVGDARLPGPGAAWALVIVAAALTLAARAAPRARPWALVAAASFAATALEGAAILAYQAWSGALFRDLGILLTTFMAGLSGGAWLAARAGPSRRWPFLALAALALSSLAFAAMARAGVGPALVPASAVLVVSGAAVAFLFGHAGRTRPGADAGRVGGTLYAADLLGGCLGLVLSGLLVAVLGLDGTALAAGGLAAAAAALIP